MRLSRTLSIGLLAWMLCFQAVAGMADARCRHPAPVSAASHGAHAAHGAHQGMDMSGDIGTMARAADGIASICACGTGCVCSGACLAGCLQAASPLQGGVAYDGPVFSLQPIAVTTTAAHGGDLDRPPSIS